MRYLFRRFAPRFDLRWVVGLILAGAVVAGLAFVRWTTAAPILEVLALGPDGQFHATLEVPAAWGDTATVTPDAVARFPLILGVRNAGFRASHPHRLVLSVPARYRLTGPGGEELKGVADPTSPLVRYELDPRLSLVEPQRLPVLLPAYESLWLEAVIPRYYCVEVADSIPDFVPAPPPALHAMSQVRMLYTLEDSVAAERWSGTITLQLDTTLMVVTMPSQPPTFRMEVNAELAQPDLGLLQEAGTRSIQCGEPEAPMRMESTIWEAEGGARLITLEYGGVIRKHLYDLNGDGVIDRESWDPEGRGRFTATRRAQFSIPDFLLPPPTGVRYDMARFEDIPPDSLARLDPLRGAMTGPGPLEVRRPDSPAAVVAPPPREPPREELPEPQIRRPAQPLGRPIPN
jgi:hypothetical protein